MVITGKIERYLNVGAATIRLEEALIPGLLATCAVIVAVPTVTPVAVGVEGKIEAILCALEDQVTAGTGDVEMDRQFKR